MDKNKIGRNDQCPCGSGKKYKKCCMGKENDIGKLSHEKILAIQEGATHKLLEYIDNFIFNRRLGEESIEFEYDTGDESEDEIVFKTWFSIDYITPYGKSFITHLLESRNHMLSIYERKILEERNKSYVSLYRLSLYEGEYLTAEDILIGEKHIIWEPELKKVLVDGDVFLARIADLLGNKKIVGVALRIPDVCVQMLAEGIIHFYNMVLEDIPSLEFKEYLKKFSSNVYTMYSMILNTQSKTLDVLVNGLPEEVEAHVNDFENYLIDSQGLSQKTVEKHISNIIDFYVMHLNETQKQLHEIDAQDIHKFIMISISTEFISSKSGISFYLTTFKKYAKYLHINFRMLKKKYLEIVDTCSRKEYYMNKYEKLKHVDPSNSYDFEAWYDDEPIEQNDVRAIELDTDEGLERIASRYKEAISSSLLTDYDKYIDYIKNNKVKVTKINKHISRKHIHAINDILINKMELKKSINQIDIPLFHLFYKFSIDNQIIEVSEKDYAVIGKGAEKYSKLSYTKKFALILDYIWNKIQWNELTSDKLVNYNGEYDKRNEYLEVLSRLKTNIFYDYEEVRHMHNPNEKFDSYLDIDHFKLTSGNMMIAYVFNSIIIKYFEMLNLLAVQYKDSVYNSMMGIDVKSEEIMITKLGNEIFKYLSGEANLNKSSKGKVISLFDRKKTSQ